MLALLELFKEVSNFWFLQEATARTGPDIIIEMLANVNLEKDLSMIAKKGRIVVSMDARLVREEEKEQWTVQQTSCRSVAFLS